MKSVTFAIDGSLKKDMGFFPWVNWSEAVKLEIAKELERLENLEKFLKIISKSRLTTKDAQLLSQKVKESLHKRLQDDGLI